MTDGQGCPIAVQVYPGNTSDSATVPDQVRKLRERFGMTEVLLIGDRGMLTRMQIAHLREHPGLGWISALRSPEIRDLAERADLLAATERDLTRFADALRRRTAIPLDRTAIALKVGKVIQREAALDGIHVLRTSVPAEKLSAADTMRRYKSLSQIERLFRTLASVDLQLCPIRHHCEQRVRVHNLLCMLAYYVEWHMRPGAGSVAV